MYKFDVEYKLLPLTKKLQKYINSNAKKIIFENNKTEFQIDKELEEDNKRLGVEFFKQGYLKEKVRISKYKQVSK